MEVLPQNLGAYPTTEFFILTADCVELLLEFAGIRSGSR